MSTEKIFLGEYITSLVNDYFTSFPKDSEEKNITLPEEKVVEKEQIEPVGIASELQKKFDEIMSLGSVLPSQDEEEVAEKKPRKISSKKIYNLPKI